jgi:hypothetical protein
MPSDTRMVVVAPRAVHPADGEGGKVIRTAVGVECFLTCTGSIRTLPRDWRRYQPSEISGLAALAADLATHPRVATDDCHQHA